MSYFYIRYSQILESLKAEGSPAESNLRDSQIGDVYIWLVKSGNTYSVERRQAPSPNDPKFEKSKKVLYSGDEATATKKFNDTVQKTIQEL